MAARYMLFFIIFICVVSFSKSYAVKFYSINSLHGISLREVNSVCSDNYGFIWASSKSGILRLTEDDYRIYELPYGNTNVLVVKLVYEYGRLVAYTNNGQIFLFNTTYDRFELVVDLSVVLDSKYLSVYGFLIDESGTYWIATTFGFYKYQNGQLTLFYQISSWNYSVAMIGKHHIALVENEGIWVLDMRTDKSKCVYNFPKEKPVQVSTLFFDAGTNKLWIGTLDNGLFIFNLNKNTLSPVLESTLPTQPILAIEKNSESTYMIGVDGQGIWEIDSEGRWVVNVFKDDIDDASALKGNGVYDLYCDANKRVWVCTFSGGLSFFDQATPMVTQVTHLANNRNSLINNDVNSVIEDREGKLWFATNNGVSCWDVRNNKWNHFLSTNQKQAKVFLTLCEDDKGRIWAGSYSSGVYVLDGATGRELEHYATNEKDSPVLINFVIHIFKDSQRDIWIGGINGDFVCYNTSNNSFKAYVTEPISVFSELKPGKMLLGCSYGLLLFDKESGERTELLMGVSVRDILVVNDDVWICTGGDGVIRYNHLTNTTEKINSQSGLPSNFVNSIVASGDYLFIGTESGLCRLSPNTNSVQVYPSIYSLSRTSFNKASHFKLQNGQLAWGTNNGAVIFEPLLLMNVPSNGTIFFQDLSVSGRSVRTLPDFELNTSVDSLKSLSLKHFQNTFSLELLPLQTLSGAKFSWKLDGFDKDWSLPSDNRMVTYTNLPSGDFVLNVRLYDSSLSRIIHERSVAISVVPPFWKSLWFWGLVYLVLIGLALLVLQYYLKSLHQKHTEEKVRFFTNTAHDIRTSLTLIKAPVEELSRETNLSDDGRHYLSIAIEQARRLSTVVTQLMDFQKVDIGKEQLTLAMVDLVLFIGNRLSMFESLAKSKNIDFVFTPSVKSYLSAIDESKMEKIVDNLISNAIKYSNTDNKVLVEFNVKEKEWSVLITDFGIGMSKDVQRRLFKEFFRGENAINSKVVGSGIGLLMAKDYVSLHNGTITCYSQEGVGSKFLVTIPYKYVNAEAVANSMQTNSSHLAETSFSETFNDASGISDIGSDIQEPEMKVLIVEDNDDLLAFMKRTLSRYFVVCTAENGQQALEVIEEQMPDLVVSDIMMPGMDGFELCEKLKSSYETAHIPVVLLTALSEKSEQLKGLGLGADDYLTKPFDMNLLVQRIKSIIRNRIVVREKALKLIKVDVTEPILANELNDRFMKRLLEVAKLNIGNSDFNKDDFAFAMNVSSSLLYKKVKSLTNLSPTDLIKVVRLEHALELLQARQYTVTEISEMCGFASVGYFGTVFRKHFGKLPTEILEQ